MGCAASRIDKEERVQICRERKRLMKHLVGFRAEFADAQLAYLKALKNTGVTLRQFTESETLELDNTPFGLTLPPSPPPPLPPSPPPPPPFSPDLRNVEDAVHEEIIQKNESGCRTPLPPPVPSSSWDFWGPICPSSLLMQRTIEVVEQGEEEDWAETNTEFVEEEQEEIVVQDVPASQMGKARPVDLADDNSSIASWHTKDTTDMAMVVGRSRKNLSSIVKELDDYFLKASYAGKEMVVLMDMDGSGCFLRWNFKENKRKRCNSAKVFSALSWSWSSKSLQLSREAVETGDPGDPCRPGAHCVTLDKIYAKEQKLYKEVREEENTKLELERKSLLLQKQENENYDCSKTEKTRTSVENLQTEIISLQQSISRSCSSMLRLIEQELHPQLVTLTSGMVHMWRTMYECHQVQNHISQQLNNLSNFQSMGPCTKYRRQATAQLESEVTFWYNSFCKLIKSQQEYVKALCRWVQLTARLVDDHKQNHCSSAVRKLCEGWQLALDRLPHKVASEAIKSLLTVVQSIALQQAEEHNLQRKCDKLQRKLHKESEILAEMEMRLQASLLAGNTRPSLSPGHPVSVKRAKAEALKKQLEAVKAKHLSSIHHSWAMTLNNLQTSLPNLFRALTGFSSECTQAFGAVQKQSEPEACQNGSDVPQA